MRAGWSGRKRRPGRPGPDCGTAPPSSVLPATIAATPARPIARPVVPRRSSGKLEPVTYPGVAVLLARSLSPLALLLALAGSALAQRPDSAPSPFRPLVLPAPNLIRNGAGRPGSRYWQQRVDYRIRATLDPAAGELRGSETIHYLNRSPDALRYLWLFLDQNICDRQGITEQLDQPPLVFLGSTFDFSCKGFDGGLRLGAVRVGTATVTPLVSGTTMRIDLPRPLASGAAVDLAVEWRFTVPDYGAGRMGRDGTLFEIAQWYPRLAVYDDVRGWNHDPYIGAGEFYLEYGGFDVALTVPADYVVAATGVLRNPEVTLTAAQRSRLARAAGSAEPVA